MLSIVCIIKGYTSLKNVSVPATKTGLFALRRPIPCTGTLTTISGMGYCLDDSPDDDNWTIQYSMRLHIARRNPASGIYETIPDYITTVGVECGNEETGEFDKDLDFDLLAGDFIVVEVEEECVKTEENLRVCPFLPVAETGDATSCIMYSSDLNFRTSQELCGALLAIEAVIQPRRFKLPFLWV